MICENYRGKWLEDAPVIIVACGDHDVSWNRWDEKDHGDIDVAIAVEHMALAATELGLDSCWVCAFDAEGCHKALELPDNLEVVALLPIGYPDDGGLKEKVRKNIGKIVSWQSYGQDLPK